MPSVSTRRGARVDEVDLAAGEHVQLVVLVGPGAVLVEDVAFVLDHGVELVARLDADAPGGNEVLAAGGSDGPRAEHRGAADHEKSRADHLVRTSHRFLRAVWLDFQARLIPRGPP